MSDTITPGWMTIEAAVKWSGLSESVLQILIREKHVISSNCKIPGNTRGRRLIKLESLDAFITSGVDAPPAELAMNKGKAKP